MAKPNIDELNQILTSYQNTINDTLQVFYFTISCFCVLVMDLITDLETGFGEFLQLFEQVPSPTQDKLYWNDVLQISDHLSKQATIGFSFASFCLVVKEKQILQLFCCFVA